MNSVKSSFELVDLQCEELRPGQSTAWTAFVSVVRTREILFNYKLNSTVQ